MPPDPDDQLRLWNFHADMLVQLAPPISSSPLEYIELALNETVVSLSSMVDMCPAAFARIDESMARIPTLQQFCLRPEVYYPKQLREEEHALVSAALPILHKAGRLVFLPERIRD